jgi:hypothetical protein
MTSQLFLNTCIRRDQVEIALAWLTKGHTGNGIWGVILGFIWVLFTWKHLDSANSVSCAFLDTSTKVKNIYRTIKSHC